MSTLYIYIYCIHYSITFCLTQREKWELAENIACEWTVPIYFLSKAGNGKMPVLTCFSPCILRKDLFLFNNHEKWGQHARVFIPVAIFSHYSLTWRTNKKNITNVTTGKELGNWKKKERGWSFSVKIGASRQWETKLIYIFCYANLTPI